MNYCTFKMPKQQNMKVWIKYYIYYSNVISIGKHNLFIISNIEPFADNNSLLFTEVT